jgi:hypothetical protein
MNLKLFIIFFLVSQKMSTTSRRNYRLSETLFKDSPSNESSNQEVKLLLCFGDIHGAYSDDAIDFIFGNDANSTLNFYWVIMYCCAATPSSRPQSIVEMKQQKKCMKIAHIKGRTRKTTINRQYLRNYKKLSAG